MQQAAPALQVQLAASAWVLAGEALQLDEVQVHWRQMGPQERGQQAQQEPRFLLQQFQPLLVQLAQLA